MESSGTYKNRALQSLEGKWGKAAIAILVVVIISGGISSVATKPFDPTIGMSLNSIWTLLCLPLTWGSTVYFLNLIRNHDISIERLFDGYKDFVRIFLAELLITIAIAIGFVLFIVPGIVVALMFAMTDFILKDNKEMSSTDAIQLSMNMMKGHKMQLFGLTLSLIGWAILSLLTLGIGFLFLVPYYESAKAHFYEDLKAEQGL